MNISERFEQDFSQQFADLRQQGKEDCRAGIPARLDDPEYVAGYSEQYQLEQIAGGLSDDS